ncbi:E3 ubiquitin-protein ligase ATL6-like protein [Cinnamomum micranthum f. kanehirae]|uniref:RING-type E3 ubiquitin transferase n=1 Tax=Cinnamomum micranthum f. kanehirae TaxID=337451 RepID=A0A443PNW1_9MAGN|nr:E3 ubiquitin-protein ligase ATL6-like protein [Cinnamomum micranthum f. kanehirae]
MKKKMTTNHSHPIPSLLLLLLVVLACAPLTWAQQSSNNTTTDPTLPYKLNPSMLIIIFVLISAFFFMGFFSIYIRQCAGDSDTNRGGSRRNGLRGRSRRLRGLDPAVIETFPVLEYSVVKGLKLGKSTLECAVCLCEFEDDETLRLIPKCSHVFHPDCIDMWLSSHTTCPVCRADLVPGSDTDAQAATVAETVEDRGTVSAGEAESSSDHVAITVDPPEVINPIRMPFPIPNRPIRSKSSRRPPRFPRSHSTGHSLVQPGENFERFTLRLPENVRKEIVSERLNRSTSLVAMPAEGGSSRGKRWFTSGVGGGEGSSRGRAGFSFGRFDRAAKSDRWVFSMMPPFLSRTGSVTSQKRVDGETSGSTKGGFGSVKWQKRFDGETSGSTKGGFGSVKMPFDCLGAKGEASAEEPARAATPVFSTSNQ